MTCQSCGTRITLLTSQRNGNLDTCLSCAIAAAPMLRYTLRRKSDVIVDEVLCQAHYRTLSAAGQVMQSLSAREQASYTQTVVPYTGTRRCDACEDAVEQTTGAA